MAVSESSASTRQEILVAVFRDEPQAQGVVSNLLENGFPSDMVSVLGRVHPSGDDVLGIYYTRLQDRVEAWARQGVFWGGLWGLLAGASAFFVMPVLGPVFAAGPIVEAIVGTLAAGVAGAVVGGTAGGVGMAGAAALTHLAVALHRSGVPQEEVEQLHRFIEDGHFVVMLRDDVAQMSRWTAIVEMGNAQVVKVLPYHSLADAI